MESNRALAALIEARHGRILARWRRAVRALPAARGLDSPALRDQVPALLRAVARHVAAATGPREDGDTSARELAAEHGMQRMRAGFDVEEVVAEYNLLRRSILDEAAYQGVMLSGETLNLINRVLDLAIAESLANYVRQKGISELERTTQYLAFVVHDMKSPLATLTTGLDVIRARAAGDADIAAICDATGRSVQQLGALVQRLLEESRRVFEDVAKTMRPESVPLHAVVDAVFSTLRGPAETRQARLVNRLPKDVVVEADPNMLDTVFTNLVHNAIEHAAASEIEVGAEWEGDMLRSWVADNGRGMPGHGFAAFEPYTTGNAAHGGTGLGLYMVRRYVEAHGGSIRVEPGAERGTRFVFTLRRAGTGAGIPGAS